MLKLEEGIHVGDYCGTIQENIDRTGIYYDVETERLRLLKASNDNLTEVLANISEDEVGKTTVPWNHCIRDFKFKDIAMDDMKKTYDVNDNVLTFIIKWLMNAADQDIEFWRVYFDSSLDFNNEKRILEDKGNISLDKFQTWMEMFGLEFNLYIVEEHDDTVKIDYTDFEVKLTDDLNILAKRVVSHIHMMGYTSEYIKDMFKHIPTKRNNYITSLKGGKTRFDSFLKWKSILRFEYVIPIMKNNSVLCYYSSKQDDIFLPIR